MDAVADLKQKRKAYSEPPNGAAENSLLARLIGGIWIVLFFPPVALSVVAVPCCYYFLLFFACLFAERVEIDGGVSPQNRSQVRSRVERGG